MIVQANMAGSATAQTLAPRSDQGVPRTAHTATDGRASKVTQISTGGQLPAGAGIEGTALREHWRILDEVSFSVTRLQTRVAHLERLTETVERMTELARRATDPGLAPEEQQQIAAEFDRLAREMAEVSRKRFADEPLFGHEAPAIPLETEHERWEWRSPDLEASPYADVQRSRVSSPAEAQEALPVLEETARTLRSDRDRLREASGQLARFAERLQVRAENFAAVRLRLKEAGSAAAAVQMVKTRLLARSDEALQGQGHLLPERVLRLVS